MVHRKISFVENRLTPQMPPAAVRMSSKNPRYIPPVAHSCPIEELIPPEILVNIFEIGTRASETFEDWADVEEDDGDDDYEDMDSDESMDSDSDDEDEDEKNGRTGSLPMPGLSLGKVKITEGEGSNDQSRLPFQVRISHVCRRWRRVAIDTPTLWTTLSFKESYPFEKSETWIARTKQAPLDIDIDISLPDEASPLIDESNGQSEGLSLSALKDLRRISTLIIPLISRWRSFELAVSDYAHIFHALKCLASCVDGAPLLETLSLFCSDDKQDEEYLHFPYDKYKEHFLLFGGNVPNLKHVFIVGVHVDWDLLTPRTERLMASVTERYPFTTNLLDLELGYCAKDVAPSLDQFSNMLRCSPNLETLKLSTFAPSFPEQQSTIESIYLPSLRNFQMSYMAPKLATSVLQLFYVPELTHLYLDFEDEDYTMFALSLIQPMRVPSSLQSITTNQQKFTHEAVNKIVRLAPVSILANISELRILGFPCHMDIPGVIYAACTRLTRLFLNMYYIARSFFTLLRDPVELKTASIYERDVPCLSYTHRGKPPFPNLHTLTISGEKGDEIRSLLSQRKVLGASPLKELEIDEDDFVNCEDIKWLKRNVENVSFVEISGDEEDFD